MPITIFGLRRPIDSSHRSTPSGADLQGTILAISIEQNDLPDPELRQRVADAIRDCIGERPTENWKVWIQKLAGFYEITVTGPIQTRQKFFFEAAATLPDLVREWLDAYPLR